MKEQIKKLMAKKQPTVFEALGIDIDHLDEDETKISLTIDDRHRQIMGLVHGGIYALLIESAASMAAACALTEESQMVVGIELNANHVRSAKSGKLFAISKKLHQGGTTMVYEVRVEDEQKRLISIGRCTLMIVKSRT